MAQLLLALFSATTNSITVFSTAFPTNVSQLITSFTRDCEFPRFYTHFLSTPFNPIRSPSMIRTGVMTLK